MKPGDGRKNIYTEKTEFLCGLFIYLYSSICHLPSVSILLSPTSNAEKSGGDSLLIVDGRRKRERR